MSHLKLYGKLPESKWLDRRSLWMLNSIRSIYFSKFEQKDVHPMYKLII